MSDEENDESPQSVENSMIGARLVDSGYPFIVAGHYPSPFQELIDRRFSDPEYPTIEHPASPEERPQWLDPDSIRPSWLRPEDADFARENPYEFEANSRSPNDRVGNRSFEAGRTVRSMLNGGNVSNSNKAESTNHLLINLIGELWNRVKGEDRMRWSVKEVIEAIDDLEGEIDRLRRINKELVDCIHSTTLETVEDALHCPVCMNMYSKNLPMIAIVDCKHTCCSVCFPEILQRGKCPTCRGKITDTFQLFH